MQGLLHVALGHTEAFERRGHSGRAVGDSVDHWLIQPFPTKEHLNIMNGLGVYLLIASGQRYILPLNGCG